MGFSQIRQQVANKVLGLLGVSTTTFTVGSGSGLAKLRLNNNSATGNFTLDIAPPNLSGNVTITLPSATGTLATVGGTETLTSKTLTAPIFTGRSGTRTVTVDADGATLVAADSGKTYTNTGASAASTAVLPAATVGMEAIFHVNAAFELRIDPNGSQTIGLPSTGVQGAAGKYLTADAVGEWVKLVCVEAGKWTVEGYFGTWAHEA